jgi:hypothetical protein
MAPAVSPLSGPRTRPVTTTADTVSTPNTSPEGKRKAPMVPALMNEFDRSWLAFFTWPAYRSPASYARSVSAPDTTSLIWVITLAFLDRAESYAFDRWRCTRWSTKASGAATMNATRASTQSYASITPATNSMSVPSSNHARPPHWKN